MNALLLPDVVHFSVQLAARLLRRPKHRGTVPLVVLSLSFLAAQLSPAHAAALATGGTGQYRSQILWLTWGGGVNGTKNVALTNGMTTSANLVIGGQPLNVTCALNAITLISGTAGGVSSYSSGSWAGDALDDLYHIGGANSLNTLVSGIANASVVSNYSFGVTCTSTLNGLPFRLPGVVVADAEQSRSGEFVQGQADGTWNVMEAAVGGTCAGRVYNGALSTDSKTLTLSGAAISVSDCPSPTNTVNYGPAAMGFLTFNSTAYAAGTNAVSMNFQLNGGGKSAVAIGLLIPNTDYGDAPAGYGSAGHIFSPTLTADSLSPGAAVNISGTGFAFSKLGAPLATTLGDQEDDDGPSALSSAAASLDDTTGLDDEDALGALAPLSINVGQPYTVMAICRGPGFVRGWLDFELSGAFDALDASAPVACSGGVAILNFTQPVGTKPGLTYLRLRMAAVAADLALPTGFVGGGEVEDHPLTLTLDPPTLTKSYAPASTPEGSSTGSLLTLTLGNPQNAPLTLTADLTDDIGAGLTILNVTGGTCAALSTSFSGTVIRYAVGALIPAGGCTITARVVGSNAGSYPNVLAAGALQTTGGPNPASASATLTVTPPNLTLTKTGPANARPSLPGQPSVLTYQLTVSNAGPDAAIARPTTVTEQPPAGLTVTALSGAGWTCTLATLSCERGDALASGASWPPIMVTATAPLASEVQSDPALGTLLNSASLTRGGALLATASHTTQLVSLTLTKAVRNLTQGGAFGLTATGKPGEVLEYCITYSNPGGATITNMILSDAVPKYSLPLTGGYAAEKGLQLTQSSVTLLTSAADSDAGELSSVGGTNGEGQLQVAIGLLAPGDTGAVCFQTSIR